jgi:hypothetical protein
MKKILTNALESVFTTITGSLAGITEIREGVIENNPAKIIVGVGIMLLGIFAKEK